MYIPLLQIRSSGSISSLSAMTPRRDLEAANATFSSTRRCSSHSGVPKIQSRDDNLDIDGLTSAAHYGWVILDGPVDPLWVEMLNPLLDDNRMLCLTSGETLPLRDGVNIIMEVG